MKQQALSPEAAATALRSVSLPDVVTVRDLEDHIGLSGSTLRAHLRAGRLPGRRVGRRWLISRQALLAFLAENAVEARPRRTAARPSARAWRILEGKESLPREEVER